MVGRARTALLYPEIAEQFCLGFTASEMSRLNAVCRRRGQTRTSFCAIAILREVARLETLNPIYQILEP